jgi:hypothetical protein
VRAKIVAPLRGAATTTTYYFYGTVTPAVVPFVSFSQNGAKSQDKRAIIALKANKIVEHKNSNAASRRSYYFYGKVVSCCQSLAANVGATSRRRGGKKRQE